MSMPLQPIRVQVLRLRGELTHEDVLQVRLVLMDYLKAGLVRVVINVQNVDHIHLAAVPTLAEFARRLKEYDGGLVLCGASPYLKHIIDLSGRGADLRLLADEDEAARQFGLATL